MTTSRRHVAVIPEHRSAGTRRSVTYRNLGVGEFGDPLPDWFLHARRRAVVDHCVTTAAGYSSSVRRGTPQSRTIAVEAESATDLKHRGTLAFLPATEFATVPSRRLGAIKAWPGRPEAVLRAGSGQGSKDGALLPRRHPPRPPGRGAPRWMRQEARMPDPLIDQVDLRTSDLDATVAFDRHLGSPRDGARADTPEP
jgi:hypothetical protein